jgi:hypothetical protein
MKYSWKFMSNLQIFRGSKLFIIGNLVPESIQRHQWSQSHLTTRQCSLHVFHDSKDSQSETVIQDDYVLRFLFRSYDKLRAVAAREGLELDKYGDVLTFHADNTGPGRPSKKVEDWRADPCVLSVTEEGLPPGWAKIVRQCPKGRSIFFKSPTKTRIRWVPRTCFSWVHFLLLMAN